MGSHFRTAARVDGNHKQIVRELRALGARVDDVSRMKKLYDLVVTWKMLPGNEPRTVRIEVKMPGKLLSVDEIEYHNSEPYPETLLIAHSTEEVMAWFGR